MIEFIGGFSAGAIFGILFMCMFQINNNHEYLSRKDEDENEK